MMPVLWSARRLSHPCKLELRTAQLLKHELIVRKRDQVNCRRERRLDFDSTLIAELISAVDFSAEDGTVTSYFSHCLIFTSSQSQFTVDADVPAAGHHQSMYY